MNLFPHMSDNFFVMTCAFTDKNSSVIRILAVCVAWLIVITILHHWRCRSTSSGAMLRVGYLPITCHLLCPVTLEHLNNTDKGFNAIKFNSWPEMIEALRGGKLDMAFILAPIAIAMRLQGVSIKVVLLGHRNGTAMVVRKGLGISSITDLKGRTVAIPIRFSCQNLALLRLCRQNGVSPKDLNILEMPPPDMPSAMAAGGIDAYIVGEPYAAYAEMTGSGKILYQMSDVWPNFISSVLVAREDVLRQREPQAKDLIRAFYRESFWVESHRKEAAELTARFYGLPPALLKSVLVGTGKRVSYTDLIPRPDEIEGICRLMKQEKLIDSCPSGQDMTDTSWLSPSTAGRQDTTGEKR